MAIKTAEQSIMWLKAAQKRQQEWQTIITALLAIVVLAACTGTGERVVDRPAFRSSTTNDILPVRVELTEDATIVHFRIRCAAWRGWGMDGARLEADGKTYACRQGRILTHEDGEVLLDEAFEFGKEYEKDARRDSVILCFDPLPRRTKTFDYIECDDGRAWKVLGIRTDGKLYPELLPAPRPLKDDGEPLQPLTLKYGEATATFTMHGDSIKGFGWFGDPSSDPITGDYNVRDTMGYFTCQYTQPACMPVMPVFTGPKIGTDGFGHQYNLVLIPGETLTVDFDPVTCLAWTQDFAAGKPKHSGYRLGGTIGDINQVMLDYRRNALIALMPELPKADEVRDFPEWRERLWQNLDTLRQSVMRRSDYTRRQKDFFMLLVDRSYVRCNVLCTGLLPRASRIANPDSALAHIRDTYTLVDPHASDLQFLRDGRSYYLPLTPEVLPYFEANGLTDSEPYLMTKAMAKARKIAERMKQGQILPESDIEEAHPYFQRILREFNDSNRVQLERLQQEASDRMMPTPDVPGGKLLQYIVDEHPGKAVFFDLWATWCGPCKKGIEAMEPLKESLQGKDIVFVYLTDESSPVNEWAGSVLSIPGLHYRIPSSKWKELPVGGGIPQYFLYDRQGKMLWEHTGFGDKVLEDIRQNISTALGE